MKKLKKLMSLLTALVMAFMCMNCAPSVYAASEMSDGKTPIAPKQAMSELTWGINLADLYCLMIAEDQQTGYREFEPKAEIGIGMWSWNSSYFEWIAPRGGYSGTFTISAKLPTVSTIDYPDQLIRLAFMSTVKDQPVDYTLSGSKITKADGTVVTLDCLDKRYEGSLSNGPDTNNFYYYAIENVPGLPKADSSYAGGTFETTVTVGEAAYTATSKPEYYYGYSRMKFPTEKIVNEFIGAGANVVRIPVTWTPFVNDNTFEIDEDWLAFIKNKVDYITSKGCYCVLDMHEDYLGKSFVAEGTPENWTNMHWEKYWMQEKYRTYVDARFKAVWEQIADYFKDCSYKLIFEPANEPTMAWDSYNVDGDYIQYMSTQYARVNDLNRMFYDVVRSSGGNNKNRLLALVTAEYDQYTQLEKLEIPENDDYLLAEIHGYILDDLNPNYSFDYRSSVDKAITAIKAFQQEHPDVPVFFGETGASTYYDEDLQAEKIEYFLTETKKIGVPCLFWEDFASEQPDIHQYWLYNKLRQEWGRTKIVEVIQKLCGIGITATSGIEINSKDHKIEYSTGDPLDVDGLTILVRKNDGTSETVKVTKDMVSGFDSSSAGTYTLTVTYDWFTATYDIYVDRSAGGGAPEGITSEKRNGRFFLTGTTSEMEYSDNESFSWHSDCTDGETEVSKPGTYYVRYKQSGTHEASESVSVVISPVKCITINSEGYKTVYMVDDPLDTWENPADGEVFVSNLSVLVEYEDVLSGWESHTHYVHPEDISGFDTSKVADRQTITITCEDHTTSFDIKIVKRDDREMPENLSAVAPTTAGGADGCIDGTTDEMEYDTNPDFTDPKTCGNGKTGGLAAGDYYVRYKETEKYLPGPSTPITVPDGSEAAITGIEIAGTGYKTVYKVGEKLDVANLSITVHMSYGDDLTVAVSENMVTGFDSSAVTNSQLLTINYEGHTASYTVSIIKVDGPAAPSGLTAVKPTTLGGNDGKIVGTTAAMEYSLTSDFAQAFICGAPETTGLAAGVYYVRYKATDTAEPGAFATVTVPAGDEAIITGIEIAGTGYKTVYKVGEKLDVANLSITVHMSYGDNLTIAVSENMVKGFDSSKAAEKQVLTVEYGGFTADYVIQIVADEPDEPDEPYVKYDANGDGEVTLEDAILTLKYAMDVDISDTKFVFEAADADGSKTVTLEDAITILKAAMNVI